MKKIDAYLEKFTKDIDYDALIDRFMDDPITKKFILDHDLTRDQIIHASHVFLTYFEERDICQGCKSLDECGQQTLGFKPRLSFYNNRIHIEYQRCDYNQKQATANIHALYMPKKIFQASMEDMDLIGESRKIIQAYMMKFIKNNHRKTFMKGLYISGKYGAGKTYILAALANELAKENYQIIFAYYPDLTRELKSSIGKGDLEEKIQSLKTVDMLFLDDFGGEYFSKFIRDEVLGSILQYRLLDNKPTFFTSNYPIKELVNVMKESNSQQESISALRIVERIKRMSEEFVLKDMPRIS